MTRYRHLITDDNRKWWTLGAMCFALFMIMLDNTVVNVALPSIQSDLGASISGLEWTTNGYTLSFAVLLATGGRLGDIFGRRRVFLIGVVIFALSSATAGLAPDQTALVVSRVVQGVGAALMMPGDALDHHQRLPAARARQGDGHLGRRLRPGARGRPGARRPPHRARLLAGDLLPQHPGRDRRRRGHRSSPSASRATRASATTSTTSASPTLTAGLTALVLALVEGNSWGWGSTQIVALLVGSVVGLAAFVFVEQRVKAPMVQFELLSHRNFLGAVDRRPDHHLRDDGRLLLPRPLHAEHPPLLAAARPGSGSCPRR